MVKNYINFLHFVLFFVFLSLFSPKTNTQCAGNDSANILFCTISDPVNQTIDLFTYLGGTPTPGGTWSDDDRSRGLNAATGILNAHAIRSGGTYHYTYTVTGAAGCADNTSTVTITVGAYPGVASPYASICSDQNTFDLFTAFNGTVMRPHSNGTWTDSSGRALGSSVIPITGLNGDFEFTYSVPLVSACPLTPLSTKVIVSISRAPEPGKTNDRLFCGNDDLSGYTNFDLFTLISGQDPGGRWSGIGITSGNDHTIDIQDLFNTRGAGEYVYTYTVSAAPEDNDNVCPDKSVKLSIILEKRLDFTGAKLQVESDICLPEIISANYTAKITQGTEAIPNGEYKINYTVSGPNGGSQTAIANFINGVMTFPISRIFFQQVGNFTVTVTNITATSSKGACVNTVNNLSDVLHVYPIPDLTGAILTAAPVCQNKIAPVLISNALRLPDGNYTILYNVTGDNFALGQSANLTFLNGNASFDIPAALNANSGASFITITNITNTVTSCTNTANVRGNLIIYPLPNAVTIAATVNDFCFGTPIPVSISGLGSLTDVTLSYTISGSNTSGVETIVLKPTNGKTDFIIPAALLLNSGTNTISLTNLRNNATQCDVNLINVSDQFIINPVPTPPVSVDKVFCKVDKTTIANLVPNGSEYKWYNSPALQTHLAGNYILKTEDYYVVETSAAGCVSQPTKISVIVNDTPAPELTEPANFCGLKNPTIQDLSNKTNVSSTITWYDNVDGNLLPSGTLLVNNRTYYGYDFSTVTDCISDSYLAATVSLINCDVAEYDFFIPDGFSPNGDNVNDTFRIPDIEFIYPEYSIEIFNRYGNIMFKGNKNKNWDGKTSESASIGDGVAPSGVYFYVIQFNKDNRPPKQGRLYLNR